MSTGFSDFEIGFLGLFRDVEVKEELIKNLWKDSC